MTYIEICETLKNCGIKEYRQEAALLLRHFCGIGRSELPFMRDRDFSSSELKAAIHCRTKRYPLQYILGRWDFYREIYKVGPGCLVPRPETELLVEKAISLLPQGVSFADLCTGSGCVAISILASRPDLTAVAVDVSEEALRYARENAKLNRVADRVEFVRADVLDRGEIMSILGDKKLSAIISNPPYIPDAEIDKLEPEVQQEPRIALAGGEDGLDFYRALVRLYADVIDTDGFMLFETAYNQGNDLVSIARENKFSCEIGKDLDGLDRTALLRRES